ncbi:MAG: glycosyltransferase family 1 protein, partial [Dehalococcoidia bacterium]|nr:glycosyltransferase family 1 protein [Dehalococcoidia bacterium]
GLLVPPTDTAGFARAIDRLLDDATLRQTLRAKGLARAATFSWDRAAQATLAVYHAVAAQRDRRR